jgi:hypothetical protein
MVQDARPLWRQKGWPAREHRPAVVNGSAAAGAAPGAASAYVKAALDAELSALATAPEGERNETLNVAAFNLAQLIPGGHLHEQETWDALYLLAVRTGLTHSETVGTLRSAFDAGKLKPREVPEPRGRHVADELGPDLGPALTAGGSLPVGEGQLPGTGASGDLRDPPQGPEAGEGPDLDDLFPDVDFHAIWDQDEDDDDPWVLEPLLPARRLVALFSPPKIGKSLLMLELAVGISLGEKVLGSYPDRAHSVLYVDMENDPRGDVVNRLKAMGRKPDDLDNLHYLSFPRLPALDTPLGANTLLQVLAHRGADVLVIDTIGRTVSGEENDNDTWLNFYRRTGVALKAAGVTTIRLDHTGKDASKGMRGGSAKYGDVDLVWSLTLIAANLLRLECTDHRLPVPEPVLMLERESIPRLRHVVSEGGRARALGAEQEELLAFLDSLVGEDTQLSGNEAMKLLTQHGRGKRRAFVLDLIQTRDLRWNLTTLPLDEGSTEGGTP